MNLCTTNVQVTLVTLLSNQSPPKKIKGLVLVSAYYLEMLLELRLDNRIRITTN